MEQTPHCSSVLVPALNPVVPERASEPAFLCGGPGSNKFPFLRSKGKRLQSRRRSQRHGPATWALRCLERLGPLSLDVRDPHVPEGRGALRFLLFLISVSDCWSPPWGAEQLSATALGTLGLEINGKNYNNSLAGFPPTMPCTGPSTGVTSTEPHLNTRRVHASVRPISQKSKVNR